MPAFVKTKKDEADWKRAKEAVVKQYGNIEKKDPEKFFALATSIYKNICKGKGHSCSPFKKDMKEDEHVVIGMKDIIESINSKYIKEGLDIGKTIENGSIRVHRYRPSIEVTDMTNAGKRGKPVRLFTVFDLDMGYVIKDEEHVKLLEDFENFLKTCKDYDTALQHAKDFVKAIDHPDKLSEKMKRGVDVELGKKTIENNDMEITYSSTDFGVYDKRYNKATKITEKVWAAIPPTNGAKTEIAKFYKWISNEFTQKRVSKMNYRQVLDAMDKEGIKYHTFDMFY